MLLFGEGGTAVEIIQDKAIALPPLNLYLAREVMQTHRVIKKECQHLLRDMAAGTLDDVRQTSVYTMTAIVFRRVSAHLSNVASTVVQPFDKIRHDEAL